MALMGGEKMHSLDGALSESLYIYAPCIDAAVNAGTPKILSMGLGLGYNELISLALAPGPIQIVSFEKVDFLRREFICWLANDQSELTDCYRKILQLIASHFNISSIELKAKAQQALADKQLIVLESLPENNPFEFKFNSILYDAFSSETDSYLWTEEHLNSFMDEFCEKNCWFSTYAATGALKRSLKNKGFELMSKPGFGRKRESTFASR